MQSDEAKIITQSITALLARREHSKVELMQKLKNKGYDEGLCAEQVNKFADKDVQSDNRFAHALVRSAYNRGKGPFYIKQQLVSHCIDEVDIQSIIDSEEYDWFELVKKVKQKKFGKDIAKDFKERQKQMRFLQYRGFDQDHIEYAVDSDE